MTRWLKRLWWWIRRRSPRDYTYRYSDKVLNFGDWSRLVNMDDVAVYTVKGDMPVHKGDLVSVTLEGDGIVKMKP